jgi:predicted nucleic acid-binding protein
MPEMLAIDIVSDASVALKWFHAEGEEEVDPARALLAGQRTRTVALRVLDLTPYELGDALLRGRLGVDAERVAEVLDALREICPAVAPSGEDLHAAARLAEEHDLTLYDAAYAAVARRHGAQLATLDGALLRAGLGRRPSELARELPGDEHRP